MKINIPAEIRSLEYLLPSIHIRSLILDVY